MPSNSNHLELHEYDQLSLTGSEILLKQYYDRRQAKLRRLEQDKQTEKALLIKNVHGLYSVTTSSLKPLPSTANPQLPPTTANGDNSKTQMHQTSSALQSLPVSSTNLSQSTSDMDKNVQRLGETAINDGEERRREKQANPRNEIISRNEVSESNHLQSKMAAPASGTGSQSVVRIAKRAAAADLDDDDIEELDTPELQGLSLFDRLPSFSCIHDKSWVAKENRKSLELKLSHFGFAATAKNTLAISLSMPDKAYRWSINIAPPEHMNFQNLFFHFNPRFQGKRLGIFTNDKQGTWGSGAPALPLDPLAGSEGKQITVIFVIRPEAFYVFNNDVYVCSYAHRRDLSPFTALTVGVPPFDDNGHQEDITVNKVWWGSYNELDSSKFKIPHVAIDENTILTKQLQLIKLSLRTIEIKGLPTQKCDTEVLDLENFLKNLFFAYDIVSSNIVIGRDTGYIRIASEAKIEEAIRATNNTIMGDATNLFTIKVQRFQTH